MWREDGRGDGGRVVVIIYFSGVYFVKVSAFTNLMMIAKAELMGAGKIGEDGESGEGKD